MKEYNEATSPESGNPGLDSRVLQTRRIDTWPIRERTPGLGNQTPQGSWAFAAWQLTPVVGTEDKLAMILRIQDRIIHRSNGA